MKDAIKLIVVVLLVFFAKNHYDARYAKLIVGAWEEQGTFTQGPINIGFDFTSIYSLDGTAVSSGEISIQISGVFLGAAKIKSESTWSMKKNILTEVPTSVRLRQSSGPTKASEIFDAMRKELKLGIDKESKIKVLKINKELFKVQDEQGIIYIGKRKYKGHT